MTIRPSMPLLAKVLGWLILHLLILGFSFFVFVRWQLGMGLDSLLSGAAGERLRTFGEAAQEILVTKRPHEWNDEVRLLAAKKGVTAAVFDFMFPESFPQHVPANVLMRAKNTLPRNPPRPGSPRERRDPFGGGPGSPPDQGQPPDRVSPDDPGLEPLADPPAPGRDPAPDRNRAPRPAFLMRGERGDGYWAGIHLVMPSPAGVPVRHHLLLIRSDHLDGAGMFFDIKPWLWGGLAVLLLSLVFWTPLVWGITRYIRRLTSAAERIASGHFQVSIPPRGNDELGNLGRTIESMASRLDHLVSGQKRFLGDAAHELCAPLARIRTGLGILEMKLGGLNDSALASIEADTAELAALVNEILAFSRAGKHSPAIRPVTLEPLIREVIVREAMDLEVAISIPNNLTVTVDPALLGRAIGNLVRNSAVHGGPRAKVEIRAMETPDAVSISVTDNGPGVPAEEIPRIFEPFYRLDRSRSRDTGGSGLGLAIVRTAIETCGGEAIASLPGGGGFCVTLCLPKQDANAK